MKTYRVYMLCTCVDGSCCESTDVIEAKSQKSAIATAEYWAYDNVDVVHVEVTDVELLEGEDSLPPRLLNM